MGPWFHGLKLFFQLPLGKVYVAKPNFPSHKRHSRTLKHTDSCPGTSSGNCYPNCAWSDYSSGSSYYYRCLNSGSFNSNSSAATAAYSVRCVLDLLSYGQLCDYKSGYGALQCYYTSSCPGSYNGNCIPNNVWSGTISGSNYYRGNLNSGTFTVNSNVSTYAFGVRCVLDLKLNFNIIIQNRAHFLPL